ncbi:MAG: phospholipase [Acidobacteria bacterium]|nr:phospholipase [Acidobacteriota bacterium]
MNRWQRPPSPIAVALLRDIPEEFVDDGCSAAPDGWLGFDFRYACRIHDWAYCTRAHPAGHMTQAHRHWADHLLGVLIAAALPWPWRWVGWTYRLMVHRHGGTTAYDSCGPEAGERCRHNLPRPRWM